MFLLIFNTYFCIFSWRNFQTYIFVPPTCVGTNRENGWSGKEKRRDSARSFSQLFQFSDCKRREREIFVCPRVLCTPTWQKYTTFYCLKSFTEEQIFHYKTLILNLATAENLRQHQTTWRGFVFLTQDLNIQRWHVSAFLEKGKSIYVILAYTEILFGITNLSLSLKSGIICCSFPWIKCNSETWALAAAVLRSALSFVET